MAKFFSRLSYSIGNEDWETEREALSIQPSDKILCITASGDRPLNLLVNECKEIVSIDANPIQNFLLDLKIAAMRVLDYPNYIGFLGATKLENRLEIFKKLVPFLSKASKDYWHMHQKMIAKGVLYQGAVEKLTKVISSVLKVMRPIAIKKLFAIKNLEEQKEFVSKYWDRKWWRKLFELGLHPSISKFVIEDPGLVNVGAKIKPGAYIYDRIIHSLNHCLANQNLLFSLLFQGHASPEAFSPYLTKGGTQTIKKRLDRITIQTSEVVKYLEAIKEPTFDCFSLSDIASYMDHAHFVRLLKAVQKTAKPGARFCIRQFLSSQQIPEEIRSFFERDTELEKKLEAKDRCFIYRFTVGKIKKTADLPSSESFDKALIAETVCSY